MGRSERCIQDEMLGLGEFKQQLLLQQWSKMCYLVSFVQYCVCVLIMDWFSSHVAFILFILSFLAYGLPNKNFLYGFPCTLSRSTDHLPKQEITRPNQEGGLCFGNCGKFPSHPGGKQGWEWDIYIYSHPTCGWYQHAHFPSHPVPNDTLELLGEA